MTKSELKRGLILFAVALVIICGFNLFVLIGKLIASVAS